MTRFTVTGTHPTTGQINTVDTSGALEAFDVEHDMILQGYTPVTIDTKV